MGTARRQYPDEFKQEALELLVSSGRPLSQIAEELGIPPERLRAGHPNRRALVAHGRCELFRVRPQAPGQ